MTKKGLGPIIKSKSYGFLEVYECKNGLYIEFAGNMGNGMSEVNHNLKKAGYQTNKKRDKL